MYRHSKITFLIILFLGRHVFVSTMDQYVCFARDKWCDSKLVLCNETLVVYNLDAYMTELTGGGKNANCDNCKAMNKTGLIFTEKNILNSCNDKDICSLAATILAPNTHTTIFKLTYSCRTKGSSTTSNASSTTSDASRTTSNARSATPIVSTTASNVSSTTLASLSNESTELQFSRVSTNTLNPTASSPTPSISESNTKPSTEGTPSSTDPDITSSAQASTNILNPTASPPTPSIPDSNTKPSTKGTLSSTDPDKTSYGQASKNTLNTTVSPLPSSISGLNTTTSPKGMSSSMDPDVSSPEQVSTNTLNSTASPPTPSNSESNTKPATEGTPSSTDPDITSSAQVTDNRYTATIVVSVVVPITTVVVVVSIMMYRRGHCKLLAGTCTKRFEKHSADRADAYALSSTANANPTYNFSNDVPLNGCDVEYSEIDKIIKEPDVEYNHLNLINKEAVHEPTYNHIGHFNSSSGNTEQTYDHVGNEMFQKTDLSTLQQDTYMYSHIGAMANPASEQMVEDSYAHINGVMKHPPTSDETNQYDVAFFHLNVRPAGDFGNQDMKSSEEREFNVVGPSKVDSNNEAQVSHSYFILEKHEKEA